MYEYDYLLAGATGQIGRYLLPELMKLGSVAIIMRPPANQAAQHKLIQLLRSDELPTVILGDVNTVELLPTARHIINAAGFTGLAGSITDYWPSNIMAAMTLAHHALNTEARLHQLSSVAVAEFRPEILTEGDKPIPDPRQLLYSTSKVMVELATEAILPSFQLQIVRIGDVVPPIEDMERNWRRTHWLPILFSCGKAGFSFAPPNYEVWLSDVSELARAITSLLDSPQHRVHALGEKYDWATLREYAHHTPQSRPSLLRMAEWMSWVILHGPEARMVSDRSTRAVLQYRSMFQWTRLGDEYWTTFANRSLMRGER